MKEKAYEYKKIKSKGAIIHLIKYEGEENWKFHSWDGPAIVPQRKDSELKKAYYLNGIEYTKEDWDERLKEREGLPYYKQSGFDGERV